MNNSDSSTNLDRGDGVWRADREPALDNLMERILERNNVYQAWVRVRSNRGAPGSDAWEPGGLSRLCEGALAGDSPISDGWTIPTAPCASGGNSQATWQGRKKIGCTLCRRPGHPTSHPASAEPHL